MEEKVGLFRFIIQKLYCHHQFENIERLERKSPSGEIYHITLFRECKICGKTKIVQVKPEI